MNKTISLALTLTLFASCAEDDVTKIISDADNAITITANVGQMSGNKALKLGTAFDTGDAISLYAWTGNADAISDLLINNTLNTLQEDGSWLAASQMRWKDNDSKHYFLGVYPERTITNFTADEYTLNIADQEASDILVATNLTGLVASKNAVPLTFTHIMARLKVNLNFVNFETTPTEATVTLSAAQSATIDYITKTVTASATKQTTTLPSVTATSYQSIMVPQGFTEIRIAIGDTQYKFSSASNINLISGHSTTINLTITHDKPEVALSNLTIVDWEEDEMIEGDVATTPTMEYVDLGLPSGTLWAKCNLGASHPWEEGDLYMWGDINPTTTAGWDYYNINSELETLSDEMDAAYITLGKDWHMPDGIDFEELFNECFLIWTSDYCSKGVSGIIAYKPKNIDDKGLYIFESHIDYNEPNEYDLSDIHVFFPEVDIIVNFIGNCHGGLYWSRTKGEYEKSSIYASFHSQYVYTSELEWCSALPIRPILASK